MKKGFTLIELLVVISIISLLSSVVLASLNSARVKARHARRVSDIKQFQVALELYYSSQSPNAYPVTIPTASGSWYGVHSCWGTATADWIPGLVSGGFISTLSRDPADKGTAVDTLCGQGTYLYSSDGVNYKLIDHNMEDCEGAARLSPPMKDPARDGGVNALVVDGTSCWSVGVWTPGALGW